MRNNRSLSSRPFNMVLGSRPKVRKSAVRRTRSRRGFFEQLEDRRVLALYVGNADDFAIDIDQGAPGLDAGDTVTWNPGAGSAHGGPVGSLIFGTNVFDTINAAIVAAPAGDTIRVAPGNFNELVSVNKQVILLGNQTGVDARDASRTGLPATESVVGNTGNTSFHVTASDATIDGFTVEGNTNGATFGFGILLGAGTSGSTVANNIIQNNIAGLGLSNANSANPTTIQGNLFRNNNQPGPGSGQGIYTDNSLAGGTVDGVLIDNNTFQGNDSAGIGFSSVSAAAPSTNITISNNVFDGNAQGLYAFNLTLSEILNNTFQGSTGTGSDIALLEGVDSVTITGNLMQGGAGRALGTSNTGSGSPIATGVVFNWNSVTGYTGDEIRVAAGSYNGTLDATRNWWGDITGPTIATNPGGLGSSIDDVGGQVDFQPWLVYGATDADPLAPGFQLPTSYTVPAQTAPFTTTNNNYRRLVNMIEGLRPGQTVTLTGVFDWTEPEAATDWALGNDGIGGTSDDYSLEVPTNLNDVTITASALGDATIQGPGDLASANLEGVFSFTGAGDNQGWVLSNLEILDFDLSIGIFFGAGGTDAYNNFQILDNHIRIPADLNATVAPADVNQNIGIHFSFGINQTIRGNIIDIVGTGVSDGSNSSSTVGMQSNTSGGTAYDGLLIENNTLNVLGAQSASPATILGIWENGHAHQSDIIVRNNSFLNTDAGNDPALNAQRAFRVTSHSSATTTVTYEGNTVQGANTGFEWLASNNFAGNQAVRLWGNTLTNTNTGVLLQSNGSANLYQNTIIGSLTAGVDVVAGTLAPSGPVTNAVEQNVITGGAAAGIVVAGTSTVTGGIFNNDLSGNAGFGLNNLTAPAVNASGNWWGSNLAADVSAEVNGLVDYNPWLDVGTDTDGATAGFQGDFSVLHVDDDGAQVGLIGRVQEGIDLATGPTPTVVIEPGAYSETIAANKAGLVLDGNAANPADVVIALVGGDGITVTADDVTIRDLRITGANNAIVGANLSELTLTNLLIDGNTSGGSLTNVAIVNFTTGTGDDTIDIDDTQLSATGVQAIALSGTTTFNAAGDAGSDTFNVTPSTTMAINVLGGTPAPPTLPGDTLNVDTSGTTNPTLNSTLGPNGYQGDYTFGDRMTVTFDEIETLGTTADIAVTKVDTTDPVTAGTTQTYTITVENVGGINATNVTLTDLIPANTTFVSFVVPAGWTITSAPAVGGTGAVEASIANLAAGSGVQTFTLVVNVNASAPHGSTITNTATATTDPPDVNPANDSATEITTVQAVADVSVTKTGPTAPAIAGGTITYTIVVTNNGVSDAQNVTLSDLLPAGTTFVSFTDLPGWTETTPAVGGTGPVTATIPTLAAGSGPQTFILVVMANSSVPNGSLVTNTATVTTTTTDPNATNDSATTNTVVLTSADLTVTKIDTAQPVVAGENITYTITVNNHGLSDAQGVTLIDVIPAGTTFVSLTGPAGWLLSTPPVGGTGTISGTLATLAAGSAPQVFTLVVRVDSSLPAGANVANTVTIGSLTADPDPGNNFATENTSIITSADLSVTKSDAPDPVTAGQNITYTIIVTNNGSSDAQGVSLTDVVPAGTTFVAFSGPAGWTSTTPAVGGTGSITSIIATLPAGASATFTLVVATSAAAANGTVVSNTASVTSTTTDPVPANNDATETTTIVTSADLSITKTDDGSPVIAGEDITYTIIVTNNGVNDAQVVDLSDLVPAGTTFVSFVAPAGWTTTTPAVGSTGTVTATTATLAAGASATFTLVVRVDASAADGSTIANTATVASTTNDPDLANNSATENTVVATSADLSVTKADDSDPVLPGQTLSYTIVVTNNGSSDAQSVSLTDVIPAGTTFVSASGPAGWSFTTPAVGGTGTVTATLASLAAGQSATITLVVMVDATAVPGTTIINTATVASTTTDGDTANNTASASTTIASPGLPDCEVETLNPPGAQGTAVIAPDLDNPGQFILLVTGTANADYIVVQPRIGFPGQVSVTHNGLSLGNFADTQFTRIVVYGLASSDFLVISPLITKSALLFGGAGSDQLLGGSGDDGLDGGAGNDIIYGGAGNDTICGGDGNDLLLGQDGNDFIGGDDGVDVLYGDAGDDFLRGGDGIDFLYGGENNDRMFGEAGSDVLLGDGGTDIVSGGADSDVVSGGNGRDLVIGGAGSDTVFGDPQEDIVVAGSTTHDTDEVALAAILAEWLSSNSYVNRVNNIRTGGGANGPFVLDSTTVDDDGEVDLLWGLGGQDWFLFGVGDLALDRAIDELVN